MQETMTTQKQSSTFSHLLMNPMVRKLDKVAERDESHSATYGGIVLKTIFFMLLTGVGIAVYFLVRQYFMGQAEVLYADYSMSQQELVGALIAAAFTLLSPFLIWIIRPLIPLLGTLYCLGQGYLIAFCCSVFGKEYEGLAWISLALTMLIVLVMLILYVTGIVKVTKKFRSVVTTLFFTAVIGSGLVFVCSLIPALQGIYKMVSGNLVVSVVSSVIFIVVAALFLLVDFDCIKHTVEDQLPKKYEWTAAMALVFTVIWLYFKILNLLLKLTSAGKQNH